MIKNTPPLYLEAEWENNNFALLPSWFLSLRLIFNCIYEPVQNNYFSQGTAIQNGIAFSNLYARL